MISKIFRRNPNFVQRDVAGEFILVPIREQLTQVRSIYVLNEPGTLVWKSLNGQDPLRVIIDRLLEEFDSTPEQVTQDVNALIEDLIGIQAIEEVAA